MCGGCGSLGCRPWCGWVVGSPAPHQPGVDSGPVGGMGWGAMVGVVLGVWSLMWSLISPAVGSCGCCGSWGALLGILLLGCFVWPPAVVLVCDFVWWASFCGFFLAPVCVFFPCVPLYGGFWVLVFLVGEFSGAQLSVFGSWWVVLVRGFGFLVVGGFRPPCSVWLVGWWGGISVSLVG